VPCELPPFALAAITCREEHARHDSAAVGKGSHPRDHSRDHGAEVTHLGVDSSVNATHAAPAEAHGQPAWSTPLAGGTQRQAFP